MSLGNEEKIALLRLVPLFERCDESEFVALSNAAEVVPYPADEVLIKEGEDDRREFFILIDGKVEVSVKGQRVNELGPGDFFGEIALLAETQRMATIRTISPIAALVISEESFRKLLDSVPRIAVKMVFTLGERLAYYLRQS